MESLYGKYPKKIFCQCNVGEMDAEAVTIPLNDRCPVCHSVRRICIPKPEERMKAVSGIVDVQKAEEPVLTIQKELEPMIAWDKVMNDNVNNSFTYFSYFMTLSGIFWHYAWAVLAISSEKLPRKP